MTRGSWNPFVETWKRRHLKNTSTPVIILSEKGVTVNDCAVSTGTNFVNRDHFSAGHCNAVLFLVQQLSHSAFDPTVLSIHRSVFPNSVSSCAPTKWPLKDLDILQNHLNSQKIYIHVKGTRRYSTLMIIWTLISLNSSLFGGCLKNCQRERIHGC